MFYFQTNALGFTPEFLGRVRLAGSLASLAGKSPISLPSFLPCHCVACVTLSKAGHISSALLLPLCGGNRWELSLLSRAQTPWMLWLNCTGMQINSPGFLPG